MPSSDFSSTLMVLRRIADHFPDFFVRRRKLGPLQVLMLHLLSLVTDNRAGMKDLAQRFTLLFGDRLSLRETPTPSALSRARAKMDDEKLRECIAHALAAAIHAQQKSASWDPRLRLVGVDCVRANLRPTKTLCDKYHTPRCGPKPSHFPQVMLCTAWDLVAKMPLDWHALPCDGDERDGLKALLPHFGERDVLVCDRNFPSAEVFSLIGSGAKFIMRMHCGTSAWNVVKTFLASGSDDDVVTHRHERHGEVRLRLVRHVCVDGHAIVLATNLDAQTLAPARVAEAYGLRWGIESAFREFKGRYGLDRMTAPTPEILQHEIAALVLFQIAVAETAALAEIEIRRRDRKGGDTGLARVANRAFVGDCCRILLTRIGDSTPEQLQNLFDELFASILRYPIRPRPGRSFPRVSKRPYTKWATKASRPR